MKIFIYISIMIVSFVVYADLPYSLCNQKWCYQKKDIQGFSVWASSTFKELGDKKQKEIFFEFENDLKFLQSIIPDQTVKKLKTIPLYLEVTKLKAGEFPLAMYHYDLKQQERIGDDPKKIGGITFYYSKSEKDYLSYTNGYGRMFMFHELGHPFIHHLMAQKDRDELMTIYTDAMKKKLYDNVECVSEDGNYKKKHYATKDMYEYFSEGLAAFFSKHYCVPHNKIDLKNLDPKLFEFIRAQWGEAHSSK